MVDNQQFESREHARSECVWEATWEGLHYGMYGLGAGLCAVLACNNLSTGFRSLNVSAKTALAISPAAFLFAFCGEEKLVQCMREKTRQQYNADDA